MVILQELSIKKSEKCILIDGSKKWWKVQNVRGDVGYVPSNFMKKPKQSLLHSLRNTLTRKRGQETRAHLQQQQQQQGKAHSADSTSSHSSTSTKVPLSTDAVPAVAKFAYKPQQSDELALSKGEEVLVLEKSSDGWWKGRKVDSNAVGWFPSNYVKEDDQSVDVYPGDVNTYSNPADSPIERDAVTSSAKDVRSFVALDSNHSPVLDTVRAVYAFRAKTSEELSFDKDDVLYIIDKTEAASEWWRARTAAGETGLIPRNYVKTLSKDSGLPPTPESHSNNSLCGASSASQGPHPKAGPVRSQYNIGGPFESRRWYFGNISRADAEEMLNACAQDGDFLLRASESNVSSFVPKFSSFFYRHFHLKYFSGNHIILMQS